MDPKELREQAIRDAKSGLILDAARKVFQDKGFHEARLEDIATVAGFSKASLYNYYEDKETIFLSLMIRDHQLLADRLVSTISDQEPLRTTMEKILRILFSFMSEHFSVVSAMSEAKLTMPMAIDQLCKHNQALKARFMEQNLRMTSLFSSIFSSARARGEIQSTLDDATIAKYVGATARGVFFDWKTRGAMGDVEQEIRNLMEFYTRGIGLV